MKVRAFSVFDSKTGAYMLPQFLRNAGEATRSFEAAVNDGQSTFSKHPADFTLFEIGEFDDSTGKYTEHQAQVNLGVAVQFKKTPDAPTPFLEMMERKKGANV